MKKTIILVLGLGLLGASSIPCYASDWDKAGKALTIVEGVRVLTGGKVDLIGNITGINKQNQYAHHRPNTRVVYHREERYRCRASVWVPHFTYKKVYVPDHEEYDPRYGKVTIAGHYMSYRVEAGGHWEEKEYCD